MIGVPSGAFVTEQIDAVDRSAYLKGTSEARLLVGSGGVLPLVQG